MRGSKWRGAAAGAVPVRLIQRQSCVRISRKAGDDSKLNWGDMATSGRDESIPLSAAIKGGEIGPWLAGDKVEIDVTLPPRWR